LILFFSTVLILSFVFFSLYLADIIYFLYGIGILSSSIILLYLYLNYKRTDIRDNINRNLPFAVIHMASLAEAGIELKEIFKIISETEEYGYLAKEIKKILDRIDLGESLSDAIRSVAEETVSKDLKDFLNELVLTIKSGRKISEFLIIYSTQLLTKYNNYLKRMGQLMKTFSDLYVGMILTLPMIIISIGVMLMAILQQAYNINIQQILTILVYVGIPIINMGFLLVFDRLSKE
ncbi:MAG: type II secretion system F family protein, partial [Nanopusillaceae archaeon]